MTRRRHVSWALVPGAFGFVLGVLYLWEARRYPFGTVTSPGPGLFPMFVGLAMVLAAAGAIATEYLNPSIRPTLPKQGFWRVPAVVAAGFAFVWLMETAGFVIATVAFCAAVLTMLERRRWWFVAAISLCTGLGIYVLFYNLGVPLPPGLLPL